MSVRVNTQITNFTRTDHQLQEFALFSVLAANSLSEGAVKSLRLFLEYCPTRRKKPFAKVEAVISSVQDWVSPPLREVMRQAGIGKHGVKSRAFAGLAAAARQGLDLRTCTRPDLMEIHGIGWKTASFFLLHSREDAYVASLDVHILRWMRENIPHRRGFIPKQTPTAAKYLTLEQLFLDFAWVQEMHPAELDYEIWLAGNEKRPVRLKHVRAS